MLPITDCPFVGRNGPSEFTVVGSLKTWSIEDQVHNIKVPTLLINGEHDEAQDSAVAPYFREIAKCKWVCMQDASHMAHVEHPDKYMQIVADFLKSA